MLKKTTISLLALFMLTSCAGGKKKKTAVANTAMSKPSDTVYFDYNKCELGGQDMQVLDQQACWVKARGQCAIIEGHCDKRGTREYNLALGARRAEAVKSYLESRGVPSGCIEVTSYGKEQPIDNGNNEEAYAKNRRAVTASGCRK